LRTLLIGGGHSAYFAANAIREIDPEGKLIIVEFTTEKVSVLSKTFSFAEVIRKEIDEVEDYIKSNGSLLDAVIAATESDALNLRYCKIAKENAIPLTIAVINNPLNSEIFLREGIRYVINPYSLISVELSELLDSHSHVLFRSPRTKIMSAAVKISDEKIISKLRKELAEGREVAAVFVSPTGEITNSPKEIELGGKLYLIGKEEKIKKILKQSRR